MTTGQTELVPIRRPYTDTWIPDEKDEFRIWPPKPRSIDIDLDRELLELYRRLNPDAPIRDVDPPRPGNRISQFDDTGTSPASYSHISGLPDSTSQVEGANAFASINYRMPLNDDERRRRLRGLPASQPGVPAALAPAAPAPAMSLPAWTWQAAGDRNPPAPPWSPPAQMAAGLLARERAPMGSRQANRAGLPAPLRAYGMGSEAGLVMSPFAWRAAMADVLDRDRTQRDEPSPQRRIDASFAGVDPMRGQGLPTETGAVPLAIMANTRLGQGGGFPAPQGAPGAAAMGPPMPRPAPSPQPGAPMNILPEYAQRFAAFAGAGPLTFLERDSYLQRDPETGAYLSQPRARRDGRAAHAERLMDEDERRQLLARELMTPRLPTDPDRQVWPEYRPITDDGPRPTWPLVAAPMMSQAAARELYDAVGVPPLSAGETALDVAKSTGIGLAKVPIHALGMPGDVGSFASTATDWAARKLGASPETIDRIKRSGRRAFGLNPMFAPFVNAPTSAEIQGGVETVTGKFYEPQTAIGEKAEALAGFAGGAVMPGGIARRVVGGVVAPFVGSEGLAAIPGIQGTALEAPARMVGGVLGGGAGSARAVRTAPQSRQQNSAYIYDAPPKPQRPFAEDYPQGARADAAGKLLEDMDGRPLTAKYVAGRRTLNGPDEALTPAEINEIAKANTGKYPRLVPEKVIGKDTAGLMKFDPHTGKPKQILVHKDLPSAEVPRVTAHEVSHTIDQIAGEIPTQGITRQFRRNYNTLNNPNRTPDGLDVAPGAQPVTPVKFGYKPHQFREEYVVEALRAYLTNPNYIKTVAPKTAERLREYVNTHPQLSKIIQLNTVLGPTAAALLARELMREPPDDL